MLKVKTYSFCRRDTKAQSVKDNLNHTTTKHFCSTKDPVKRVKSQAIDWRARLQITDQTKNFSPAHIKDSKLSRKNQKIQLENGQKVWTDISLKTIYRWQKKPMERSSTALTVRKAQVKTTWGALHAYQKGKGLPHCWWAHKMVQPLWKTDQ